MRASAIREEAERLIHQHGQMAYNEALAAVRAARRRQNIRLEKFLTKVSREVHRRMDKDRLRVIAA